MAKRARLDKIMGQLKEEKEEELEGEELGESDTGNVSLLSEEELEGEELGESDTGNVSPLSLFFYECTDQI